tara:strand:- start:30 stop:206 length:177 start_codon:yes stop_codon:yes gene_type:complete
MCLICIELAKDKITFREALRNLSEVEAQLNPTHLRQVLHKIQSKMISESSEEEDSKDS